MARPKNSTEYMSPGELKECIDEMGLSLRVAALSLKIPYRSLQDYARGVTGIPAHVAAHVRAHRDDWKQYWIDWRKRVQAELDREFPNGIPNPNERLK